MNTKAAFQDTIKLASERGMSTRSAADDSLSYRHVYNMWITVCMDEFSETKLNRWLGWAQAAVVASGVATLEEMKEINRKHS